MTTKPQSLLCLAIGWCLSAPHALAAPDNAKVVQANQTFACDLYGKLKGESENLIYSPYSISAALSMTLVGARGDTSSQLMTALHGDMPASEWHPAMADQKKKLEAAEKQGKAKLAIANSLWPQSGHAFAPEFLQQCKTFYDTEIQAQDYKAAPEKARTTINAWVENKTQEKIRGLFPPNSLDSMTRMVLVNAIYFKGTWASPFEKNDTAPAAFHTAKGAEVKVPTMHLEKSFPYAEVGDARVLELPYAGDELSMLVVLPREKGGLKGIEAGLNAATITGWCEKLQSGKVKLSLPKFKANSRFSLNDKLGELGIKDAFDPKLADFSAMDGTKDLYITQVVHQAFVEVNEEGTEAAAATGVGFGVTSVPVEEKVVEFNVDQPFLYMIRAKSSGSILFLGRINDPSL